MAPAAAQGAHLTRQKLARRASCAVITIEKIEIGERRPSREVAEALARALRIPEAERAAFIAFARGLETNRPAERSLRLIPNNLPADLPALIGRDREIETITERLVQGDDRLLTLVGPGGVGKTLLALHVAACCAQGPFSLDTTLAFRDGILFADLAPIRDPDLVVPVIAQPERTRRRVGHTSLRNLARRAQGMPARPSHVARAR